MMAAPRFTRRLEVMAGERRPLSTGCIIALVPATLAGLCLLVPVVYLLNCLVAMNRHADDFAAFDHLPGGTTLPDVVKRAEDLGFEREGSLETRDGGLEVLVFERVVLPPFGRWLINVSTLDGGLVSVRTNSLF